AFVTNPTNLHFKTIQELAGKTTHMFIEKPIFDHGEYKISDLKLNANGVYYVAGPLRYSGVIQRLKKILSEEKIFCIRAICSSYLPDWRPDTDYRLNYSARKDQGGGVAIDLIHEWDYLSYLFGFPQAVYCMKGKYSHLEIDSEDIAVYIAAYNDKVVELHLDYFGRTPRREIEIFTDKGTITGDLIRNAISFTDDRQQILLEEDKNDIYLNEMRFFMDQISRNQSFNNMEYCYSVLNIALGKV
ncbi:MAG TPA: Gfo/Idh/MocA family oxidoreductase, partial [Anaerovoracaceae bacterium]|nr:Gfo/Idh/MocA family oxidoreductase [Anaerovoracaceae bacterium]